MNLHFNGLFNRPKAVAHRPKLVDKGLSQAWWQVLLHLFNFLLQLLMQLALIIFLIKTFVAPWNSVKLAGLIRICLIFSNIIAIADSGIGLTTVLVVYQFLIARNWPRVNQILSSAHRQHRFNAKTSLLIVVLVVVAYFFSNLLFANRFLPLASADLTDFRTWSVWLVMLFILSKNIIALSIVGAKENLMQADQNQNVILILNLIIDTAITALVLMLLWVKWPLFWAFLPFMCYSPLKIMLVNLFCWSNYSWLKLNLDKKNTRSPSLTRYANAVMLTKIGYWILVNVDLIIILVLFGLQRVGLISFFFIFTSTFRVLFIRILRAFSGYIGLSLAWRGRIRWKHYLQFNNFFHLAAGMCFFLQLVFVPYLVNIFFNNIVFKQLINQRVMMFAEFIFFRPWFVLLEAVISALVLLLEINNILIDVNRYHREVVRSFYVVAILHLIISFLVTTAVFFADDSYIAALMSVLSVQIFFLVVFYGYLAFTTWRQLTTGAAWPQNAWQPVLLLLLPVVIVSLLFLLVIYPSRQFSFANFDNPLQSAVTNWSFIKFTLFSISALSLHGGLMGLSGLLVFGPRLFGYHKHHRLRSSTKPTWQRKLKAANQLVSGKH